MAAYRQGDLVEAFGLMEGLGDKFIGTSNCLIAMKRDVEAIGTNAHEFLFLCAGIQCA